MRKILITGAAGFVGSHLTEKCLSEGWIVFGVDDFSSGLKENLKKPLNSKRFKFLKTDLSKPHAIKKVDKWLNGLGVSKLNAVVDLTARKIPRYGGRLETVLMNFRTTEAACELARLYRSRIIFASTSDVYGLSPKIPFKEDEEAVFGASSVARWAYGSSKYLGEQLVWGYQEEYGIPAVILRIFGVYGPRQVRGWKGNAVSAFFQQAIGGGEYELHGDGEQTRTFLYIDDLVNGLVAAIKNDDINGEVINLGSQEEISMNDLVYKIHRLFRPEEKFLTTFIDYKAFTGKEYQEVRIKIPDIIKAAKKLNWRQSVSLDDGLKLTANWYLSKIK